jgi:serine/threonine protein kinase/tetratricopeptide (TPR) repeat protein
MEEDEVARILDEYLQSLERGEPVTAEELLARNPDVADRLRAYLSGLALLNNAVTREAPQGNSGRGTSSDALQGGNLGDFRLVREIARGGMGIVYEAVQISLGRRVALKVLPLSAAVDDKQLVRFKNEAQAAAQIDHPHIVPVFAIGEERGIHYFAMQLIGGQSLSQLLVQWRTGIDTSSSVRGVFLTKDRQRNMLDRARAVAAMGIQTASALHAAHEIGVVHRDVKPSNLLIDERGKLWITDFGVARCKADSHLTQTGHLLGTMPYMSPEQARGQAALVDHRTDVYSLGVTLYELVALRHPFEEVAVDALATASGRANLRPPRHWNRSIPIDLENIILKAMAESRDERYTTARDLAEDLTRFQEGQPILARRPSLTSRVGKWTKRYRKSVLAASAALAVAVAGLVASLIVISAERNQKAQALQVAMTNHTRAEANYRKAQAKFRQAREMLDRFGARVNDGLARGVPGAEGVRKELLAEMLPYYEQFAREAASDPTLQSDLAMTYARIGALSDQLGSLVDAEQAYRKAGAVYERLVETPRAKPEHRRSLALCYNNLGQVLQKRGLTDAARTELDKAQTVQERLVAAAPSALDYQADLATTRSNRGLLESRVGANRQGAAEFRAAIDIQESLLRANPQKMEYAVGLAASCNNLSSLFTDAQPETARQLVERALSLQLSLVRNHPQNRDFQSDLALSYNNLGTIYTRLLDWEQAEKCFLDATTIQQRLVTAAPLVSAYRRDLAVSFNNLGMTQSKSGSPLKAKGSFEKALATHSELVTAYPQDVNLLSALGGIHNNLGMVYRDLGRLPEAAESLQEAIDAQQQAYERAPAVAPFRESLSKHYYNFAQVLCSLDGPADAAEVVLKRRELWKGDAARLLQVAKEQALICKQLPSGDVRNRQIAETIATLQAISKESLAALPDLKLPPFDVLPPDSITIRIPQASGANVVSQDNKQQEGT